MNILLYPDEEIERAMFNFCLLSLIFSLDTSKNNLTPYFCKYLWGTQTHKKISPQSSSLQGEQTHHYQPFCVHLVLQILDNLDGLLLDSLQCIHVSHVLGSRALQMCLTSAEQKGKITSLNLLAMFCLMQPWRLLAFFAARAHCCLTVNQSIRTTPGPFFPKLLPTPHSNKLAIIIIGKAYRQL